MQTQEYLNSQIINRDRIGAQPRGVAVMLEAEHSACRCALSD